MNQYIILEDSILAGLQVLALSAETAILQQQITNCAEKFNQLGCDYQDTWTEEFWTAYELIREGYQKVRIMQSDRMKTATEIAGQITDVQELALSLNRTPVSGANEGKKVLMEIDELSKQHLASIIANNEYEIVDKKCCKTCVVS
jgi:hypothetical protein